MDELDAYSRTVSAVAAELTGKVAAVRTGRGSGSAVVVAGDGVLVTNAHVVGDGAARPGRLRRRHAGRGARWSAPTRSRTSPCCARSAGRRCRRR